EELDAAIPHPSQSASLQPATKWGGALRVMLDKVDGDMVHLHHDLRWSKENAAFWTIISSLL
ncbi:MAG: hypothetical protein WA397_27660, partial [Roseiarcus sp.]